MKKHKRKICMLMATIVYFGSVVKADPINIGTAKENFLKFFQKINSTPYLKEGSRFLGAIVTVGSLYFVLNKFINEQPLKICDGSFQFTQINEKYKYLKMECIYPFDHRFICCNKFPVNLIKIFFDAYNPRKIISLSAGNDKKFFEGVQSECKKFGIEFYSFNKIYNKSDNFIEILNKNYLIIKEVFNIFCSLNDNLIFNCNDENVKAIIFALYRNILMLNMQGDKTDKIPLDGIPADKQSNIVSMLGWIDKNYIEGPTVNPTANYLISIGVDEQNLLNFIGFDKKNPVEEKLPKIPAKLEFLGKGEGDFKRAMHVLKGSEQVIRSKKLDNVDLKYLKEKYSITHVIDFREHTEVENLSSIKEKFEKEKINFNNFPIKKGEHDSKMYIEILNKHSKSIVKAFKLISTLNKDNRIVVFCERGVDRTGTFVALLQLLLNYSKNEILDENDFFIKNFKRRKMRRNNMGDMVDLLCNENNKGPTTNPVANWLLNIENNNTQTTLNDINKIRELFNLGPLGKIENKLKNIK
ncbi:MAG: tyrosine-protein phosphatase [Candidatus Paraimprobicoccus trichonymphae]|uniref:Tyrosine-protein phosphatase n=1 Tax=Candidatus Paraimprobicoccus trichonymphae TaxID=3033793 RepID=A0AA48HZ42_9FIRM|nr:MAG: tyrosine-protein phosphatase [Candidatus Paraimprobicoccus trichonymphae]